MQPHPHPQVVNAFVRQIDCYPHSEGQLPHPHDLRHVQQDVQPRLFLGQAALEVGMFVRRRCARLLSSRGGDSNGRQSLQFAQSPTAVAVGNQAEDLLPPGMPPRKLVMQLSEVVEAEAFQLLITQDREEVLEAEGIRCDWVAIWGVHGLVRTMQRVSLQYATNPPRSGCGAG